MDKQELIALLGELSNANGASGFEDEVVEVLRRGTKGLGEFSRDSLLNAYVERAENKGARPRVLLDAHSDEVAFIVQAIQSNGCLSFLCLGGWTESTVPAHAVRVRNRDGIYIPGVIASKPPHYSESTKHPVALAFSDMLIDVGATSREEAIRDFGIRIGEPVVPDVNFRYLENHDLLWGKAFDCRIGCAAAVATLRELSGVELDVDVVAAFSAQEEIGIRGAEITPRITRPDLSIVFEGCPADDTFVAADLAQTALGRGSMLRHFDCSMVTNPRFQRWALDVSAAEHIPAQEAVRSGGGTDGARINLSGGGVPAIVIGVPVRYAHTHHGISAWSDLRAAINLAKALLTTLNADVIATF